MAGADPSAQFRASQFQAAQFRASQFQTASGANLITAIRGPVMLITVGVLFAIDHLGGWSVGRTWPVFLIVLGLFKLAEHLQAKTPAGPR